MKILVIPDVHLKPWMFDRADEILKHDKTIDNVVCLGDIPDDWGQKDNIALYCETFGTAEAFFSRHPKSILIKGNHEMSYLWDKWQSGKTELLPQQVYENVRHLYDAVSDSENGGPFLAYRIDRTVFSHAGITVSYIKYLKEHYPDDIPDENDTDNVLSFINSLHRDDLWMDQSPLWTRPQGYILIYEQMWKTDDICIQVVGHTPMGHITQECSIQDGRSSVLISCDTFSTYRDGTPYGDETFLLIDTITGNWKAISAKGNYYDK